ncbi:unnamed protein product [Plasmodium vivax]|uniref:(malaria parasite P. vivax) hypothetical protein n=1 Tax=Plasmodium vivax TaxID=5855 RepID=A0A8S4HKQ7_PLAVI|nr:unnamed protein product [Plasmodium vivax]
MPTENSCFHSKNIYLDYKCYNRLKEFFDYKGKSTGKSDIFDQIIEQANIPSDNILRNNKILHDLEQHLRGDGVFYEDHDECCKYINFWLNKEIKTNHSSLYNDSKFHTFKEFVTQFNKIKNNKSSTRCLSNINYIEPETFEKLSKLYELYDYFTDSKLSFTRFAPKKTKCQVFGHLIGDHNRALADYQAIDPDLIERLIDLKKLIENANIEIKEQCYYKKSQLHISKLEAERKRAEIQKQQEELEKKQQELKIKEEEARRLEEARAQAEEESKQEATREAARQRLTTLPLGNDVFDITGEQGYQVDNEIPRLKDYTQHELERYTGTSKGRGYLDNNFIVQQQGEHESPISSSDVSEHTSNFFTDRQGTMGKITGAVTDVFGQVDPVPVVGVSGGMGALFLLFRYTPVGTFFRGRGRRQGIPTRFDGVYPGFMTNFQGDGFFPNNQYNIAYGAE